MLLITASTILGISALVKGVSSISSSSSLVAESLSGSWVVATRLRFRRGGLAAVLLLFVGLVAVANSFPTTVERILLGRLDLVVESCLSVSTTRDFAALRLEEGSAFLFLALGMAVLVLLEQYVPPLLNNQYTC